MAHIKELDGIDFIIKSKPLTKDEEIAISAFIKAYKAKQIKKKPIVKVNRMRGINKKKVNA